MAEVTGDLGGQPIELNNAATESTLRELVNAMGMMAVKLGTKAKSQAELEKELKKFQEQVKKATDTTKDLTKEQKEAIATAKEKAKKEAAELKAREESAKKTYAMAKGLHEFGQATSRVVLGMTNLLSSLSNVGNSMTSAASTMNAIPIVGGVLAGVFGAVAEASEKLLKSYQQAATVGVTFGGSMSSMVNAASGAGLTIDQFSGLIAKNGEALAMFGGNTEAGAKKFAELGKEIKNSQIGKELLRMGYSTEQVNSGMAGYIGQMSRLGLTQGKSTAELAAGAGKYLKELDGLAKLTGQSREALQAEQDARLQDAQFNSLLQGKTKDEIAMLQNFVSSFPKAQQGAVKEMLATGNITSEAGVKFNAMFSGTSQEVMAMGNQIRATGRVNDSALKQTYKNSVLEQKAFQKSAQFQTMSQYAMEEYGDMMVASTKMAANDADAWGKIQEEQRKTTEKANQAQEMEQFKQRLAETSNVFAQILAQSGLLEHLEDAFDMLVNFTLDYVVPTFQWLADHFTEVATVAAILGAGFMALKAIVFLAEVQQGLAVLGMTAENMARIPVIGSLIAMAGAVWAAVAPVLAAAAPFIAIAVAVGAAIYIFKKFGGDMQVVADGLKYMWSGFKTFLTYLKLGFLKVLDYLPGIDMKDKINEAEQELLDQKEEREKLSDGMAARMAENRARAAAEEEEERKKKLSADQKERDARTKDRLAARDAAKADKEKAAEAKKAADADKEKAAAASGIPTDVGTGDPLKDIALYGRKKIDEAAAGVQSAAGTPTTGTPPPMNQDQKKNMEMIEASLKKQGITDPKMIAAIKGNVMKESGGKSISENMSYGGTDNKRIRDIFGSRAAGKSDAELNDIKKDPSKMGEMMYGKDTKIGQGMGNTEAGDGFKYRGRGFIQLTGKGNYAAASKAIYGDDRLVKNPDMVNDPQVAADVAAWYMKRGSAGMAKQLGVDQGNMTQEQANLVATSTIAGRAIKPGEGYLGKEALGKVNMYSQAFANGQQPLDASGRATAATDPRLEKGYAAISAAAKTPPTTPATPTSAAAQSATTNTQMVMVGDKSYVKDSPEHKAALAAEEAKKKNATQPGAPKPGEKPQESVETLLAQLNSQVGELLAVTRDSKRVNERQLGVMADNSSNLYAMGA